MLKVSFVFVTMILLGVGVTQAVGCAGKTKRPCSEGGQPPREDASVGKGNRRCEQIIDASGKYLNHGHYLEWFPNGKRAIQGDYANGLKTGKWTTWDDQGKKLKEKWYEEGHEVSGREAQPYNGLTTQPRSQSIVTSQAAAVPAPATSPTPKPSPSPKP